MPLQFIQDDITRLPTEAIANAANETLLGGGGVDGAIHRAAGPELLEECRGLGGCRTGDAKLTKGYKLPADYVIHTVGPIWRGGGHGEEELLRSCYRRSLELAREQGIKSLAFPLISAGVYAYPKEEAIRIAREELSSYLLTAEEEMMLYLVIFDEDAKKLPEAKQQKIAERLNKAGMSLRDLRQERNIPAELKGEAAGFAEHLKRMLREKSLRPEPFSRKANIPEERFKVLVSGKTQPSVTELLASAFASELSPEALKTLLQKPGCPLSPDRPYALLLLFFAEEKIFDLFRINRVLFAYELPQLGSAF